MTLQPSLDAADQTGQIFIGRQPILDREERVVAYELLYRDSAESQTAIFSDHRTAATRIMANTFASMGADAILGPYTGFLNADRSTLVGGLVDALPMERVVIEILENVEADAEVRDSCKRLSDAGFSLALDDFVVDDPRESLLEFVGCVKVDLPAVSDARLPGLVRRLRRKSLTLVAEKVETREQFERCHELGFDLFQGFYFARPIVISGKRVDPARSTLLKLLHLIRRDVETEELCETIEQHPSIGVNILRLVNSAAVTHSTKLSTVQDAVTFLGRRPLHRWLNVLLYAGEDTSGLSSPLLQTAAKRGRLMELLAKESLRAADAGQNEDSAFLAGMASMLDALLGVTRDEVVRQLSLDDDVSDALLGHRGDLGHLLQIAELLETGDFSSLSELLVECGITPEQIARAELEAFRWVQELGQGH